MNNVQILMMNQQIGYGYLYNMYAVSHANFSPTGWHAPSNAEFDTLLNYLGGESVAAGKLKETGYEHWESPNTGATNESGFTAFGSGIRRADTAGYPVGAFGDIRKIALFWSSTEASSITAYFIGMRWDRIEVHGWSVDKKDGFSVRLIKDSTTLSHGQTSTMTDEDGNVYNTICIGTQEWITQNWKCTKLNDGTSLTKITNDTTWANAVAGDLYYCAYNNDESYV